MTRFGMNVQVKLNLTDIPPERQSALAMMLILGTFCIFTLALVVLAVLL